MEYTPTIGLEIHAELKTMTKMFCDSKNDPDEERPNVNVCPVCMGHPGTLPVVNREAVKNVLKVGLAVGGNLADFTEFDRKNYFYPDIPKGYQISQYKHPLVSGGSLAGVALTRIHLEEDTGTSLHEEGDYSLINFNRAGVPLMELVTEPVIHSAKDAGDFARELQLLLRYLGVAEANMEKGEMRVEANISLNQNSKGKSQKLGLNRSEGAVGRTDSQSESVLGTKVEVKNLNSFRAVEKAIEFEIKRQGELLDAGERVVQETRGWDENSGKTFSQRLKEDSHDYRYFPDPDIPKFKISEIPEFQADVLRKELPELPADKHRRFASDYRLKESDVEFFIQNRPLSDFFENAAKILETGEEIALAANYLISDIVSLLKLASKKTDSESEFDLSLKIKPVDFAALIKMISNNRLSSRGGKDTLKIMAERGGDPETIANSENLIQKSDSGELKDIVSKVISENPKVAADYKAGKESALQYLVGLGMKATRGSANPRMLRELFRETLDENDHGI